MTSFASLIRALAKVLAASDANAELSENRRDALFREYNEHLRETERRFHQTFIVSVTASVGFLALTKSLTLDQRSAWLWFAIAAFGGICWLYMCLLLNWKRGYHDRIARLIDAWRVPPELRVFGRGQGSDRVLLCFVGLLSVLEFGLGAYSIGRPAS